MKKVLFILVLAAALFACNQNPDNTIHAVKTEPAGWVYDSVQKKNVQAVDSFYKIAPTWGQAAAYVDKRADRILTVSIGLFFLILFIGLFVGQATNASWLPKVFENMNLFGMTLFIAMAFSVYFLVGDMSEIRWNNDKWVSKKVYDEAMQSGSTQPIWDSLENNHLIIGGPYKK